MANQEQRLPTVEDAVRAMRNVEDDLQMVKADLQATVTKLNPTFTTGEEPEPKHDPLPPLSEIQRSFEKCMILIGDLRSRITHLNQHLGWDSPSPVKEPRN